MTSPLTEARKKRGGHRGWATLGTRGNLLAKSDRPLAGETSVRSAHFGPHTRFAGLWPAGFSKRVASGTQGKVGLQT